MTRVRPPFAYYGGKARLAGWIVAHFPPHDVFVDLFGGAANVILNKPPAKLDVYNDIDGDLVNFFRVLRERPDDLIRAIELTPYSRAEFEQARTGLGDTELERARRFYVLMKMSSYPGRVERCAWRSRLNGESAGEANRQHFVKDWLATRHLYGIASRLRECAIDQRPALDAVANYDDPETLFYADPPYLEGTRGSNGNGRGYTHEFAGADDHTHLAAALRDIDGMAVISGYPSALYDGLYAGWQCVTTTARDSTTAARTECLWLSPRVTERLAHAGLQLSLFAGGEA
ncbi:MAG: DNA adenine methylase [Opitutaceae bacterium]|nr:DNA adenine methylase [Opitutaceae bacterium]